MLLGALNVFSISCFRYTVNLCFIDQVLLINNYERQRSVGTAFFYGSFLKKGE